MNSGYIASDSGYGNQASYILGYPNYTSFLIGGDALQTLYVEIYSHANKTECNTFLVSQR